MSYKRSPCSPTSTARKKMGHTDTNSRIPRLPELPELLELPEILPAELRLHPPESTRCTEA